MIISEIMEGLQGEGKHTGYKTTFIRTFGCNLKCAFCDSRYACEGEKYKKISITNIMKIIQRLDNQYICITGGEPLLQPESIILAYETTYYGFKTSIETNGSVAIDKDEYKRSFHYVMDIKTPSSGMDKYNIYSNMHNLLANDELKFVISDETDYEFAKETLKKYYTKASIIFSPTFDSKGKHNGTKLAEWILRDDLKNVRLGLQTHKILNIY
jgi:7-carboxy-7-deazaguanine synthase